MGKGIALIPIVFVIVIMAVGAMVWSGWFAQNYDTIEQNESSPMHGAETLSRTSTSGLGSLLSIGPILGAIALIIIIMLLAAKKFGSRF